MSIGNVVAMKRSSGEFCVREFYKNNPPIIAPRKFSNHDLRNINRASECADAEQLFGT